MEEQVFDRLCLDVWRAELSGARARLAAELIISLASLRPGSRVIDFGCGAGQIAQALALHGICVTGVDRSRDAIAEANNAAHPLCTFIEIDWRNYAAPDAFDCALFWYTTLCSGNERDFESLCIARRSLRDAGILLVETRHWDRMVRRFEARSERCTDDCVLVEDHTYDPVTGVQTTEQCYFLSDQSVRRRYQTRRYAFAELRGMCLRTGFHTVEGFDEQGQPLSNESERALVRARSGGILE